MAVPSRDQLRLLTGSASTSLRGEPPAAAISQVIKAIKRLGVEARDISTDRYIIQPLYEDWDSLSIKGYRIFNVISITLRDVSKTSEAIASAFDAGANQVVNVEFYTSELRKYRDQARELAVKAAQEKAAALAATTGQSIGVAKSITENRTWWYGSYGSWWGYGAGQMTQNVVQNSGGSSQFSDEGTLAPGQIAVSADVTVEFELFTK